MRFNIEEEQLSKIDFNFDYNLELKNKNLDNFIKLSFKLQIKNKLNTYDYLMLENSFNYLSEILDKLLENIDKIDEFREIYERNLKTQLENEYKVIKNSYNQMIKSKKN